MTEKRDLDEAVGVPRRHFLESIGFLAGAAAVTGFPLSNTAIAAPPGGNAAARIRANKARKLRRTVAQVAHARGLEAQTSNGDEQLYSDFIGSFSKGLPHNSDGEVDPASYLTFRDALDSRNFSDLDTLAIGPRKLENPRAGVTFGLQGADPASIAMPPAPAFASAEEAGEIVELYWMALLRDVAFEDYAADPLVTQAVNDLNGLSDFRGPRVAGNVTPQTLFRSPTPGDLAGPYISQFLLLDVPYGTLNLDHRQNTFNAGSDHMTSFPEWLSIQQGNQPSAPVSADPTPRYIRNLRDLAAYVQRDVVYQAYLNAAITMLGMGVPFSPQANFYAGSPSEVGFINFGAAHLINLMGDVSALALRAVWYQKWMVHRRLRPEAFGGRIDVELRNPGRYPIHPDALNSAALGLVQSTHGSALLPMAYPEGSPRHPAYGAGHNTVAAACASVLKAFFDESYVLPNPVVPDASGLNLVPYTGPDSLTVGGEIDKLAGNIAQGRNAAGVHWRSDYTGSMPLGEKVTESILAEQKFGLPEDGTFSFTRFDGSTATI